jgi:prolyl-tRNA synthetase
MRWEMRTRLFLRTAEFLWQEGHTFHATQEEAEREVDLALGYYRRLSEEWLAMPVIAGLKTRTETFAGAVYSKSVEAMMRDGLALQSATSHYFGQNFSRAYNIAFSNQQNEREFCSSTSWGVSTRIIGAIVMAHGDNTGLIMPPRIAPIQVVAVPIFREAGQRELVAASIEIWRREVEACGIRLRVDWSHDRPGEKFNRWELKGVPIRIEIGPQEAASGRVTLVDRLRRERQSVPSTGLAEQLRVALDHFHGDLYQRALTFRAERTYELSRLTELVDHFRNHAGFVLAPWCESAECEAQVKDATGGVTARNYDPDAQVEGPCLVCARPATRTVAFARAY